MNRGPTTVYDYQLLESNSVVSYSIFAHAAGVYLRLMLPRIKDCFLGATAQPLSLVEHHINLVGSVIGCPLFIFGCIADDLDKDFIRKLYQSPNVSDRMNPLQRLEINLCLFLRTYRQSKLPVMQH